jgi:hypothetical protein
MASERQIRANRRNALKSTGPRTAAGKAASSRNALRHGLTAHQVVIEGEDPALFDAVHDRFRREFHAVGAMEEFLVERLAGLAWRLRRVPLFEAALLAWIAHRQAETHGPTGILLGDVFLSSEACSLAVTQDETTVDSRQAHERRRTGRMLQAVLSKDDLLSKLGRYEALLMKQVERTLAELRLLIAARAEVERRAKAKARAHTILNGAAPKAQGTPA